MDKKSKFKKFVKEHKWQLIASGISAAALAALGIKMYKDHMRISAEGKAILSTFEDASTQLTDAQKAIRLIDEEIFTDLAVQLEAIVLDEHTEKAVLDRSYDLPNGLIKYVTVTVEQQYD